MVGHLDEDGYLKQELEELRQSALAAMSDVEIEELQIALRHVQNLEPTGVGARDVPECLALQLNALPDSPSIATPPSRSSPGTSTCSRRATSTS